jgi:glycosyltransferase involved in cell wall biosynthesis
MAIGVFTIASKNYLAYVRVLMSSIARLHPEYKLYLCLADRVDGCFDPKEEGYEVVQTDALGIPDFEDMTVRYDIMEFNTAVKPFMFEWLFKNTDLDAVIYLDPDIRAYSRFDQLEALLRDGASMVLTPHLTRPLEDGKLPDDQVMLQAGVFNLGFAAVRRCAESREFLAWWSRRLATQCVVDVKTGLFVDQKWCDLAPCFLQDLRVLRDPGHNAAYWNLAQRSVAHDAARGWTVDGRPLVFFHFSGISVDRPRVVSKHQNRLEWKDIPSSQALFSGYLEDLVRQGSATTAKWPYAYARTGEGFGLPSVVRWLYRVTHPGPVALKGIAMADLLADLCNRTADGFDVTDHPRITKLMRFVYDLRPDVQAAFRLDTLEGRRGFAAWFAAAAPQEYGLAASLAEPDREPAAAPARGRLSKPVIYRGLAQNRGLANAIYRALPQWLKPRAKSFWLGLLAWSLRGFEAPAQPAARGGGFLDQPAQVPQLLGECAVSNLMHMIWASRLDLQHAFDLGTQTGQQDFINWYKVSVQREYGLEPTVPAHGDAAPAPATRIGGEPGVGLIGYAHTETGVGEHVRMSAAALSTTDVPFGVVNFAVGVPARQNARLEHGRLIEGNAHRCNLFHVNADQILVTVSHLGRAFFDRRYNILYPFWELAKWPDAWVPTLRLFDEIWAPSRFIYEAIAPKVSVPVRYMPVSVTLPEPGAFARAHFGLPEGRFLFLFAFDFLSYIERKNPFAIIRAFQKAFPRDEGASLVIKVMNADSANPHWTRMLELVKGDPRIVVINQTLNRDEVLALYRETDCFVSLHRSEGFGRGPAEAMYLGKPVIVTNYSGSTDFTPAGAACLVDYKLIPVEPGQYVHEHGQVWADADVDHAAWYMRKVFSDEAYRRQIAAAGERCIREHFSPAVCGANYRRRLAELKLL